MGRREGQTDSRDLGSRIWWQTGQQAEGGEGLKKTKPNFYCEQMGDGGAFTELGTAGGMDLREKKMDSV